MGTIEEKLGHPVAGKVMNYALKSAFLALFGASAFFGHSKYISPVTLKDSRVTEVKIEKFEDDEICYWEMIHTFKIEGHDDWIVDRTKGLKEGDHIRRIAVRNPYFFLGGDEVVHLEKYE